MQAQIVVDCQAIDDSAATILSEGILLSEVEAEMEKRKSDVLTKHLE